MFDTAALLNCVDILVQRWSPAYLQHGIAVLSSEGKVTTRSDNRSASESPSRPDAWNGYHRVGERWGTRSIIEMLRILDLRAPLGVPDVVFLIPYAATRAEGRPKMSNVASVPVFAHNYKPHDVATRATRWGLKDFNSLSSLRKARVARVAGLCIAQCHGVESRAYANSRSWCVRGPIPLWDKTEKQSGQRALYRNNNGACPSVLY